MQVEKGAAISCDGSAPPVTPPFVSTHEEIAGSYGGLGGYLIDPETTYGSIFIPTMMGWF